MFIEERMGLSLLYPTEGLRAILPAQLQAHDAPRLQPARSRMASKKTVKRETITVWSLNSHK